MYDGLTRSESRLFFCNSWSKYLTSGSTDLTPIEQIVVDWILQHPEYHLLLEDRDNSQKHEYTPEQGQTNPFLHLAMHLAISEQVALDSPPGIKKSYYALIKASGSEHDAAHEVMECLGEAIWVSQRNKKAIDFNAYSKCVRRLVNKKSLDT